MGIGKKQYQHLATLGPPLFAHGRGGLVVRARLGAAKKKKTEKRTIVTFLVSPPSQYTCVPTRTARGPSSAAGCCRLDYDLCIALRCFASLSRGGASDGAWADEFPSTWVAVVPERMSWSFRHIRSVTEDFGPCCRDGQAEAVRLTIIRRRRRTQFERTALHEPTDVSTTISTHRPPQREREPTPARHLAARPGPHFMESGAGGESSQLFYHNAI